MRRCQELQDALPHSKCWHTAALARAVSASQQLCQAHLPATHKVSMQLREKRTSRQLGDEGRRQDVVHDSARQEGGRQARRVRHIDLSFQNFNRDQDF